MNWLNDVKEADPKGVLLGIVFSMSVMGLILLGLVISLC